MEEPIQISRGVETVTTQRLERRQRIAAMHHDLQDNPCLEPFVRRPERPQQYLEPIRCKPEHRVDQTGNAVEVEDEALWP